MPPPERLHDSANKLENSRINGVNIQDGGTLSKVIQDIWINKARHLSGSLSSIQRTVSLRSNKKEDERSLKLEDQLSQSDSFTSNFDDVFDSPKTNEIPEVYQASHPYNIPAQSNPYIQRYNVNTPGKNPFLSRSSDFENAEKIVDITVIPCRDTPDNKLSNKWTQEAPLTPLRANTPRRGRTPSIKLHTPEPSRCISLAHSRPMSWQEEQHPEKNSPKEMASTIPMPMPMPRTNPKCTRFSKGSDSQAATPYRHPGDGEHSPFPSSTESFQPLKPVLLRTETDTGSLYEVEGYEAKNDEKSLSDRTSATAGTSLDKSFDLMDASPATNEPVVNLKTTPVDLASIFASSNTPKEVSVDVTPAPTVCSSYQAQLNSGLSGDVIKLLVSKF
ncbi:unnamed protein product [Meganyctiphanes norvegica]|uniref:Uncharacterized protein n=1 Tax=Meganyctiphanes norvegica TaxID=48144 RepID=A0AAV2PPV7_MEGNR